MEMLRGMSRGDSFRALQPAVSDDGLIIFPLAGKFAMLGHAEDVGIFVCPEFAVASNGDNLVDNEETKVEVGFSATDAVLSLGPILEDLHAPLVDNDIGGLMNFKRSSVPTIPGSSDHSRRVPSQCSVEGTARPAILSCRRDTRGIVGGRQGRELHRRKQRWAARLLIPKQSLHGDKVAHALSKELGRVASQGDSHS